VVVAPPSIAGHPASIRIVAVGRIGIISVIIESTHHDRPSPGHDLLDIPPPLRMALQIMHLPRVARVQPAIKKYQLRAALSWGNTDPIKA
jgi:hypothetical protein